jgi:hypothetical protein
MNQISRKRDDSLLGQMMLFEPSDERISALVVYPYDLDIAVIARVEYLLAPDRHSRRSPEGGWVIIGREGLTQERAVRRNVPLRRGFYSQGRGGAGPRLKRFREGGSRLLEREAAPGHAEQGQ